MFFSLRRSLFHKFVCVGAETLYFPHMRANMAEFSFAPVSVWGPIFARKLSFEACWVCGGMIGDRRMVTIQNVRVRGRAAEKPDRQTDSQ